ncbi:MAG: DUF748 domain-containing protein [Candidatus Reddybacter sp.]
MQQVFGDKPLKSYRLWLLIGFLSYTLGGFLLLPYIVKTQLIKYVDATLQQKARLEAASFNPFLLRLRLQNLQLTTPEQAPLLEFGELVVDFDTFGLFKGAWQFSTVSLSELEIFAAIDSAGKLNLNRLIPAPSDDVTPPEETAPGSLPRLILQNIAIEQSRVHFRQLDRAEPFNLDLAPLNFNIVHFSTLPEDGGQFSFDAKLSDRESLEFSGALQVEPLAITGHIALNKIELKRGGDYLQELLLFSVNKGTLSLNSDFTLDNSGPADGLALQATNISIAVQQLRLDTLPPLEPLLRLDSISLNNASFAWPEQIAIVQSLVVDSGSVHSWLTADKVLNYTQLVKSGNTQPDSNSETPLQLRLEKIQLTALQLSFDDRSLREPAPQTVNIVDLKLSPFTLEQDAEFDLQAQLTINKTGKTTIAGKVGAMPPMAALTIGLREIPLPPINSYLHDAIQLNLTNGSVDADLQLDYQINGSKSLALHGDIAIKQLDTFDLADQEKWIHWQNLAIKALDLQLEPTSLNIASIELVKPYFDAIVFENSETRLYRMLVPAVKQPSASSGTTNNKKTEDSNFPITIAKFKLIDGTMDYKDFNLPLNFATHIHSLNGQAVDISTVSSKPAELVLDGKIDQHGKAKITATSQLSSPQAFSKIKLDLSNVNITSASSYSGKFAGYAIDAGTLGLNLDYRIEQGQMHGDNHLLLESLTLGEAVDSPDALSLPLKLAVALMKDVDGNIDIDLPVEGDLNNPEVQVGGIIWKAFANLLVKVAASPFNLLGGLFENADHSDLDNVVFTPGSSELTTSEQQSLDKLAQALHQKPALALSISACYHAESDGPNLQTGQFNQAYQLLSGHEALSSDTINYQSSVLETMYISAFGDAKLTQLKAGSEHLLAEQSKAQQSSDDLSSLHDKQMRQALINAQTLTPEQLTALASQRGERAFNYLTNNDSTGSALSTARVQIKTDLLQLAPDAITIACPLTLSAL